MLLVTCHECGKGIYRYPKAAETARFCSGRCCQRSKRPAKLKDQDWLNEHYTVRGLGTIAIAQLVGSNRSTVLRCLEEFGIQRRAKGFPRGESHPDWKGGRMRCGLGYIYSYAPDHPNAVKGGYVAEHRLVMEKRLGRYLQENEVVHHKNEIKDDNRLENLAVMTPSDHMSLHKTGFVAWCLPADKWSKKYAKCVLCGTTETPYGAHGKCKTCYNRELREVKSPKKPKIERWSANRDSCADCGSSVRKHCAKGCCKLCYNNRCRRGRREV